MDELTPLPTPPPPGDTLVVAKSDTETRVTLRSHGAAPHDVTRTYGLLSLWGLVEFLGFWVGPTYGWALLLGWSILGIGLLCKRLYAACGRDVLTLGEKKWTTWRGFGPFGVARTFDKRSVNFLNISRRNDLGFREEWLEARVDGKLVELVSHGSPEEREWLLELLQQERKRGGPTALAIPSSDTLPTGWQTQALPGQGLRLVPPKGAQPNRMGCLGYLGLGVNIAIWNQLFEALWKTGGSNIPVVLGTAAPWVGFGLALMGLCEWSTPKREEWRADRGRLLLIRRLRGRERVQHLTHGALALEATTSGTSTTWSLVVRADGERHTLGTTLRNGKLSDLKDLGALLAQHTGWPLHIPPEAGG